MPNASWFEILYVCTVVPGVICSIWRIRAAQKNVRGAYGPLRWIGQQNVETAGVILFVQVLYLLWGVISLFFPNGRWTENSPLAWWQWATIVYTLRTLTELAALALTTNAIRAVLLRKRVWRIR